MSERKRILFIGDIFGRCGRLAVRRLLPELRAEFRPHLVIANGENLAGGRGLNQNTAEEMREAGVDLLTTGNHVWDQRDAFGTLDQLPYVIRPLNYPDGAPGRGYVERDGVLLINAMGRVFMRPLDDPFRAIDLLLADLGRSAPPVRIVDFHAEATSEKVALAYHLEGRVSAVLGTHTHVPTADARILPGGTAACTDVGMVGGLRSVIGLTPEVAIAGFLSGLPTRFEVAGGPAIFNSVFLEIDSASGRAISIERIDRIVDVDAEKERE